MDCAISNDINRHINLVDQESHLAAYKEHLYEHYKELILSGDTVLINRITYSFDEVISDAAIAETIDAPMMDLLRGDQDSSERLKKALEEQLEKLLDSMIESKLEEAGYV